MNSYLVYVKVGNEDREIVRRRGFDVINQLGIINYVLVPHEAPYNILWYIMCDDETANAFVLSTGAKILTKTAEQVK